jgi:polyhydroxybutyrate depolymerase
MKKIILLSTLLAFLFNNSLDAQVTGSFMHDGVLREYRLFLPSNYQNYESLPLVFNLHGFGSNALEQEIYTSMNQVADTAKFFVCTPQGYQDSWNVGWAIGSQKDDVGFISALIDTISSNYNVNLEAVFSTGMSNGGFMSYKLACDLNDRIRAIASVAGGMEESESQNCAPPASIPIMQIHGTADDVVLYNGTAFVNIPIEDMVSQWVDFNECALQPDTLVVPDIDPNDGTTSERIEYNDCDGDSRVVFYKITDGGHTWPGAFINIGVTSKDFYASLEIWRFFRPYASPLILSNKELKNIAHVEASPNPFKDFVILKSEKGLLKTIQIHNAIGQPVFYQSEINSGKFTVPTSDFQQGIYFITIETTEGNAVLKTVKQ